VNRLGRRGQGSLEYIATYGWAVLVVMVVGIAMWLLGVFSQPVTTSYSGFTKLKPVLSSTGMSDEGAFAGIFVNGVGQLIVLNSYTCRLQGSPTDCDGDTYNGIGPGSPYYVLRQIPDGEMFPIDALGCFPGLTNSPARTGQYVIDCTIRYDVDVRGKLMTHSDSGTIRGGYVEDVRYDFKGIVWASN